VYYTCIEWCFIYQHGPPHLTNLMVQPGQAAQPPPQQPQPVPLQQPPQQMTTTVNADPQQQQQLVYGQQVNVHV
jgi:hypothetical protein